MKTKNIICILLCMLLLASCTSYKRVAYLQNSDELAKIEQHTTAFEARVQPKDLIIIQVLAPEEPSLSYIYNFTTSAIRQENTNTNISLSSQPAIQPYLVDNDGTINFPVVGKLHVAGKTRREIESLVLDKIKGAFKKEPIVTMRFHNFKVSVLGDVNRPGTFTINNERVNVLEAIALAGDLTIYGRRDNVMLLREHPDGRKEIHQLNLNDISFLTSPYYHLQQNDILYITPNSTKAKNSDVGNSTTLWFSATSILISLTSLLYNILR